MLCLRRFVLCCLLLLAVQSPLWAQTPDAGALRQQIERDLPAPLPPRAAPLAQPAPAPSKLSSAPVLSVQRFVLQGSTLVPEAQLQAVLQPFLQTPLGFDDLQRAAQAVAQACREAGWIVRTSLPPQDVTEGTVIIHIAEARFAGARLQPPEPTRVAPQRLLALVQAQQQPGQPLSADALDRALLLADDLPGLSVTGMLEPGADADSTALVLTARDTPLINGEVGLDNAGARSTGRARLTLGASLNSPLQRGDLLRADAVKSEGSDYLRGSYSLPLGNNGLRGAVSASTMNYRLVGADFAALGSSGDSSSLGLELSYPLLRSRTANLNLTASLDQKRYRNDAQKVRQSDYRVRSATAGLAGNRYGDRGVSSFSLSMTDGRVNLGTLNAGEAASRGGSFNKLRYTLAHQQQLADGFTLQATLTGQYSDSDLDSSERFYLGGAGGVRAYPVNEGSGVRGQLLNLELRKRVGPVTVAGFVDHGRATSPATALLPAQRTELKGAGVALAWTGPAGLELRASVATRIGRNPHPQANGHDQDGTLQRARAWVQVSLPF